MYTWFRKGKSLDLTCFANASYGGEANTRMRTTSSSKTKSAEFYPIFLALSFCLFRNIFGRSTLDKWRFLRIASNITRNISRWSHCFSVVLLVCLVVYVLGVTMNISQSFQNGEKKRKSPPFRNVWKEWSAHHKNWEESFFHQRGSFLPFESANYSQ